MEERALIAREFPPEVHQSLAELRQIAKTAKTRNDPRLRWATEDEIALAVSLQKPWMCRGHSSRTGLPCTKARIAGATVCLKHGASIKHVRASATRRLQAMVMPMLERQRTLAMQSDNPTVAQKATTDLLDRAGVGAVVEAKVRQSLKEPPSVDQKIHVNLGFLHGVEDAQPFRDDGNTIIWTDSQAHDQYIADKKRRLAEAALEAAQESGDVTPEQP
jgi:hypothetical protein